MDENNTIQEPLAATETAAKEPAGKLAAVIFVRLLCVVLVTALVLAGGLYGMMYILAKGPSVTARNLFVRSVRETSAIGFLAELYLSDEEIAQIEAGSAEVLVETDASLVNISAGDADPAVADAWGFVDEDGDGIIIDEVKGKGYSGYMMIVQDPSRVILGCDPDKLGIIGYTVEQMVELFDAVGGTNAGGFVDINGQGNGSLPDKLIVYEGEILLGGRGVGDGFVGLDDNYILHVGLQSAEAIQDANIQYGCSFGPVLVVNGEGVDPDSLASGINPRTAIGQRSDGAILLLVIDGRQVISLGATFEDLMDIMLRYGAVNASNMDGGSSTLMYFNGKYVNNCASVIGIRPIPSAWLVLKEGAR